jgi:aspartate/methionine/tyrosine aminotransferase
VVPGWRVGWIVIHDDTGRFSEVRTGLRNLTQLVLGSPTMSLLLLAFLISVYWLQELLPLSKGHCLKC